MVFKGSPFTKIFKKISKYDFGFPSVQPWFLVIKKRGLSLVEKKFLTSDKRWTIINDFIIINNIIFIILYFIYNFI